MSTDSQIQKGREAMLIFHNASVKYSNYHLNFDELLNTVSKGHPTIFLEGFGFAIEQVENDSWFGSSKVRDAMNELAANAMGKIPSNQNSFFKALSDEFQKIEFVDAASFVVVDSGKTIIKGAQEVGDTLITTLKGIGFIFPIVVIGGLLFISYSRVKKLA